MAKKISDIVNIDQVSLGLQISMIEDQEEMQKQFNTAKPVIDLILQQCETDDALRGAIIATKVLVDVIMSTIQQADEKDLLQEKVNAIYNFATVYMPIVSLGIITSQEVYEAVRRQNNA